MVNAVANTSSSKQIFRTWFERVNQIIDAVNVNSQIAQASNGYITGTFATNNYVNLTYAQKGYTENILNTYSSNSTFLSAIALKAGNTYFNTQKIGKLGNSFLTSTFVKTSTVLAAFEPKTTANTTFAKKTANLSDISNPSTALTNLGASAQGKLAVKTTSVSTFLQQISYGSGTYDGDIVVSGGSAGETTRTDVSIAANNMAIGIKAINNGPFGHLRNQVINPRFDIWTKGTTVSIGGGSSAMNWPDGYSYQVSGGGALCTFSRQAFTPGQTEVPHNPKYYLRLTRASSGTVNAISIWPMLHGSLNSYVGKTAIISFWVRASTTLSSAVSAGLQMWSQSPTTSIASSQTISTIPTTWTRVYAKSLADWFVGTFNNHACFATGFITVNLPLSATFDIANIQIEFIDTALINLSRFNAQTSKLATEFEYRPMSLEQLLCDQVCKLYIGGSGAAFGIGTGFASAKTGYVIVNLGRPTSLPSSGLIAYPTDYTKIQIDQISTIADPPPPRYNITSIAGVDSAITNPTVVAANERQVWLLVTLQGSARTTGTTTILDTFSSSDKFGIEFSPVATSAVA